MVTDECGQFFSSLADSSISKFNFTNIFEWMPADAFERILRETYRVAKDGAILTYRNLLVSRQRPATLTGELQPIRSLALTLHQRDLSFIYRNYVVERVTKRSVPWSTVSRQCATVAQ